MSASSAHSPLVPPYTSVLLTPGQAAARLVLINKLSGAEKDVRAHLWVPRPPASVEPCLSIDEEEASAEKMGAAGELEGEA